MAVEAASRCYYYLPKEDGSRLFARLSALLSDEADDNYMKPTPVVSPPFFHNDLHDMESLWWVAIFKLFFNLEDSTMGSSDECFDERVRKRDRAISALFGPDAVACRRTFLRSTFAFESDVLWMPTYLRNVKGILSTLSGLLLEAYEKFEANFPAINMHAFDGIQDWFQKLFNRCAEFSVGIKLTQYKD